MTEKTSIREVALNYAHSGFSVVPIATSSKQAGSNWMEYQQRIASDEEIEKWFKDGKNQLAIVCGQVSGNLFVIDFDGPGWEELVEVFTNAFPEFLDTRAVTTGSGKVHLWAKTPELTVNRLTKSFEGKGNVELRANKHYVLAPPSLHPSGGHYSFHDETIAIIEISIERLEEIVAWFKLGKPIAQIVTHEKQDGPELNLTVHQKRYLARNYLRRVVDHVQHGANRNDKGFELACYLNNLRMGDADAEVQMIRFHQQMPQRDEPYTMEEAIGSLKSAYGKEPEPPWIPYGALDGLPAKETESDKESPNFLLDFALTDAGNGETFAAQYGDKYIWVEEKGSWFVWEGTRWEANNNKAKEDMIESFRYKNALGSRIDDLERRKGIQKWTNWSEANNKTDAALKMAQVFCVRKKYTDFDTDRFLLSCSNGVVDLKTGTFREGKPTDYLHKSTHVRHDPEATCPRWIQFLGEIFQRDMDLVTFIKKAIGYTLTGVTSQQCLFICHGGGANGKSTMLSVIEALMGEYAMTIPSSTIKDQRFGDSIPNDIAGTMGARYVKCVEVKEAARLNEERIKALTGGDRITARFLHHEFFSFTPVFKLWLGVNHKPAIWGTDEAIWRRIRLIPFNATFPPEVRDEFLLDKLLKELPGILNWAIEGYIEMQASGLKPPGSVTGATKGYREESDPVGLFLSQKIVVDPKQDVLAKTIYEEYIRWAENVGEPILTKTSFGRKVNEKGIQRKHIRNELFYVGLRLKSREEE